MKRIGLVLSLILLVSGGSVFGFDPNAGLNEDAVITVPGVISGPLIAPPPVSIAPPEDPFDFEGTVTVTPPTTTSVTQPAAPTSNEGLVRTIIVKRGDTLWSLAQKFLGTGINFRQIIDMNKDNYPSLVSNPDLLIIGWKLKLPRLEGTASPDGVNSAAPTSQTPAPTESTLTTAQKKARLQGALSAFNSKQNKLGLGGMNEFNEHTIRILIDNGFIKGDLEWMALNPPLGYRWAIKNGKVVLVQVGDKPITNDPNSQGNNNGKTDEPLIPLPGTKPVVTDKEKEKKEKEAQSIAEANYRKDLKDLGIPDFAGDTKDYYAKVRALAKMLPDKLGPDPFDRTNGNDNMFDRGYYDLASIMKSLKDAHQLYEKKVREGDTSSFPFGILNDSIETAGKKVQDRRKRATEAYAKLKTYYAEAKGKADKAAAEISSRDKDLKAALKRYDAIKYDPDNYKEAQKLMKEIKGHQDKLKDQQKIVEKFKAVEGLVK